MSVNNSTPTLGIGIKTTTKKASMDSPPVMHSQVVEDFLGYLQRMLQPDSKIKRNSRHFSNAADMIQLIKFHSQPAKHAVDIWMPECGKALAPRPGMVEVYTHENCYSESGLPPIKDLFKTWLRDPAMELAVNDPKMSITSKGSARNENVEMIRRRFADTSAKTYPWVLLEIGSPYPRSFLPEKLKTFDHSFLKAIGNRVMMLDDASQPKGPGSRNSAKRPRSIVNGSRVLATEEQLKRYRYHGLDQWILLGEGGAMTVPHVDAAGSSTWIMMLQGSVGFGYLFDPSEKELDAWYTNVDWKAFGAERRWRYIMLKAGQWVCFPAGTIHYVFRPHKNNQTLAIGGHFAQYSQPDRYMKAIVDQCNHPTSTNEELVDIEQDVHAAREIVEIEKKAGRAKVVGGGNSLAKFEELAGSQFERALERLISIQSGEEDQDASEDEEDDDYEEPRKRRKV